MIRKSSWAFAAIFNVALALHANLALGATLNVDIGVGDPGVGSATPNDVQTGFVSFDFPADNSGPTTDEYNSNALSDSLTFSGITVTLSAPLAGYGDPGPVFVEYRDRVGEVSGTGVDDLLEDFVFARGGDLTLTLSGLGAGLATITTYHHDPAFNFLSGDITVDTGSGPVTVVTGVDPSTGFAPTAFESHTFSFTANGTNDVIITFEDGAGAIDFPIFNGFELEYVPEPSTGMLALISLPWLFRRRICRVC